MLMLVGKREEDGLSPIFCVRGLALNVSKQADLATMPHRAVPAHDQKVSQNQ